MSSCMKVILLKDVARIGYRFEVKDVPDGHALNFLIPRKLAEPATKENLLRIEERKGKTSARREQTESAYKDTLQALAGATITLTAKANAQGHLFKGVKQSEIALAITTELGAIDASHIVLAEPIKTTGEHELVARVGKEEKTFILKVIGT